MTTPERLRRRQRRESIGIAILAVALTFGAFWFDEQDDMQRQCFYNFLEEDSQTTAVRSQLVSDESEATRRVILSVLSASTREEIIAERERYRATLERIDRMRKANPVEPFDPEDCYE